MTTTTAGANRAGDEATKMNQIRDSLRAAHQRGYLVCHAWGSRVNSVLKPICGGSLTDSQGGIFCPDGTQTLEIGFQLPSVAMVGTSAGLENFELRIRYILAYYSGVTLSASNTMDIFSFIKAELVANGNTQVLHSATTTQANLAGYLAPSPVTISANDYTEYDLSITGTLGAGVKAPSGQVVDAILRITADALLQNHTDPSVVGAGVTAGSISSPPPYLGVLGASLTIYNPAT